MASQQNVTKLLSEGSGELARLAEDWPDWHVWRGRRDDGSPGSWLATRRRYLTRAEEHAFRLFPTVDADQPVQLEARLREQAVREAANERA
jgi:hypothetical protein